MFAWWAVFWNHQILKSSTFDKKRCRESWKAFLIYIPREPTTNGFSDQIFQETTGYLIFQLRLSLTSTTTKKKDILIFINNCRIHPPTFIVDDISHYLTILLEKVIGPRWNQVLKRNLLDIKDLFIVVLKSDNP